MKRIALLLVMVMTWGGQSFAQKDPVTAMKVCIAVEASQPMLVKLRPLALDDAIRRVEDKKHGVEAVAMEAPHATANAARDLGCDSFLRIDLYSELGADSLEQRLPPGQRIPNGGLPGDTATLRNAVIRVVYAMSDLSGKMKTVKGEIRSDQPGSLAASEPQDIDRVVEDATSRATLEAMRLFRKKNKIK